MSAHDTPSTPDNPNDEPLFGGASPRDPTTAPTLARPQPASGPHSGGPTNTLLEEARADTECRVCADPAIWRAQAFDAYANVRDELSRIAGPIPSALPPDPCQTGERERIAANVDVALSEALNAMAPERDRSWWQLRWRLRLRLFYSGSQIEQAWLAIHRARAELYLLYTDDELKTQSEALGVLLTDLPETSTLRGSLATGLTHLGTQIGEGASGQASEKGEGNGKRGKGKGKDKAGEAGGPTGSGGGNPPSTGAAPGASSTKSAKGGPLMSGELQRIYEHAIGVSDRLQREARVLRNNMMVASLGIFIVVVTLGLAHYFEPKIMSLCTAKACPLGTKQSQPLDVFVVEFAGMLGGLLSVVIPLSSGERIQTPYRVFNQQLLLKTLAGAASAVGGVLLVSGKLVSLAEINTPDALLAYAVVFGFAQQIVTGAVDRRANTLAKETPSVRGV